ncbi:DUF397 domain-containing protein [Streptomyces luteireticuli]|uniref:DUF397 domain-containing protein n=1 Tax=Streptomyces luteireticuli TaxID=173858 RepID=UPI0035581C5A
MEWIKSSHSAGNGGDCLEWAPGSISAIAPTRSESEWAKSSHSEGNGGMCLEWAPRSLPATIPLRDSKRPYAPGLLIPAPSWSAFLAYLKAGA